jgi:serine/threonine protein kinase
VELTTGTRVGHYAIQRRIGAGGMGVVYAALDDRLNRQVAIKVLPSEVARDDDRLRRFEKEAQTIGSLNHPNLVTLHDVGEHDGVPYLVTELLDGGSLRAKLAAGPLPYREAVRITRDVASGLAAAHGAGVIHRDIKPDNIYVTATGRVKILDFGIAKLRRDADGKPVEGDAATVTATGTGVVIGTPGYMAPEQLRGGTIDARTDIFALGVVLYEMLAGARPFASENSIEEQYAILKNEPKPLPASTPAQIVKIVERCLEKQPEARFQSAADLAFALESFGEAPTPPPTVVTPRPKRWPRVVKALAIAAVTMGGLGLITTKGCPHHQPAGWSSLLDGGPRWERVTHHAQRYWFSRFSQKGNAVTYSDYLENRWQIFTAEIGRKERKAEQVTGQLCDISKDGELAVLDGRDILTVKPGMPSHRIGPGDDAAWSPDGTLALISHGATRFEFPAENPKLVKTTSGKFDFVRFAPDGKRIAYAEQESATDSAGRVMVMDLAGNVIEKSTSLDDIGGVAWSPDGKEVWFSANDTIFALEGNERQRVVLRGYQTLQLRDVAENGRILVAPVDFRMTAKVKTADSVHEVSWQDNSVVEGLSADGTKVALLQAGTNEDMRYAGYHALVRVGDAPPTSVGYGCAIALDREHVILLSTKPNRLERVKPGEPATPIRFEPIVEFDSTDDMSVSDDGRFLVVRARENDKPMRLWLFDLEHPTDKPRAFGPEVIPAGRHPISSDGSKVAFLEPDSRTVHVISTATGEVVPIPGVNKVPLRWGNGEILFLLQDAEVGPYQVSRVDLTTKKLDDLFKLEVGEQPLHRVEITPDGKTVAYSYNLSTSDLFVIEPSTGKTRD